MLKIYQKVISKITLGNNIMLACFSVILLKKVSQGCIDLALQNDQLCVSIFNTNISFNITIKKTGAF